VHSARRPRALDSLGPNTVVGRSSHYYLRILLARLRLKAAEIELRDAVSEAEQAGASWATIGAALGTSRQNAYQRYGRAPDG
jgi:hypothetical protein